MMRRFLSGLGSGGGLILTLLLILSAQQPQVLAAHAAEGSAAHASVGAGSPALADEAGVRSAMERAFAMLRAGQYANLYDVLPSASQRRLTRGRFIEALSRTRGMFALDRMEIGTVRVAGDLAVADTTIYARALRPFESEGKIVSRQYMVREGGQWRVTTGDSATVRPLLAANPQFARRYPPTEPRILVKRDGKWLDISTLKNSMRRQAK